MGKFGRPHARVHFGATGKPGTHTKQVTRDETGDMQITVTMNKDIGLVQILFDRPCDMIALPPDKAYDFAHLVLEHVKDKQGGEPVNITEEKIVDALAYALGYHGIDTAPCPNERNLAVLLAPQFMLHMAGETGEDVVEGEKTAPNCTPEKHECIGSNCPISGAQV